MNVNNLFIYRVIDFDDNQANIPIYASKQTLPLTSSTISLTDGQNCMTGNTYPITKEERLNRSTDDKLQKALAPQLPHPQTLMLYACSPKHAGTKRKTMINNKLRDMANSSVGYISRKKPVVSRKTRPASNHSAIIFLLKHQPLLFGQIQGLRNQVHRHS